MIKRYSLDFSGANRDGQTLSEYCENNNLIICINIVDKLNNGFDNSGHNSLSYNCVYANGNSKLR